MLGGGNSAGTRRRRTHVILTTKVGRYTTKNPPVRAPLYIHLITRKRRLPQTRTRLGKVVRTFGVTAPSPHIPKAIVKLVRPPRQARDRRWRGKVKFLVPFGIPTTNPPIRGPLVIKQQRYAGKRPKSRTGLSMLKPVRTFSRVIFVYPPKITVKLVRNKRKPGKVIRIKAYGHRTVNPPIRPVKVVRLIVRKRRLPQIKSQLSKVVRTFGVTASNPAIWRPIFRPRRR